MIHNGGIQWYFNEGFLVARREITTSLSTHFQSILLDAVLSLSISNRNLISLIMQSRLLFSFFLYFDISSLRMHEKTKNSFIESFSTMLHYTYKLAFTVQQTWNKKEIHTFNEVPKASWTTAEEEVTQKLLDFVLI